MWFEGVNSGQVETIMDEISEFNDPTQSHDCQFWTTQIGMQECNYWRSIGSSDQCKSGGFLEIGRCETPEGFGVKDGYF